MYGQGVPTAVVGKLGDVIGGVETQGDLRAAVQREVGNLPELVRQLQGRARGQVVTALPADPVDGQEVLFLADDAAGVLWRLRYRAGSASAYKWETSGQGTPLAAFDTGLARTTSSATYQTTGAPLLTAPLAGDYDVVYGAQFAQNGAAAVNDMRVGLHVGGSLVDSGGFIAPAVANTAAGVTRPYRASGVAAGSAVQSRYASASAQSATFHILFIRLVPVRVG